MKIAKVVSDYGPAGNCAAGTLCIVQTDDGDISIRTFGRGEFRLATSGGQFHGKHLSDIVNKFSELIDLLNEEASADA
jgi:hypothetical protein